MKIKFCENAQKYWYFHGIFWWLKLIIFFFFYYHHTALIHEAKFYGIAPLAKQLSMCKDVGKSNCGNILFCGKLDPPKSNHQAVKLIKAHYSTIVVAYDDHFACYQHKGRGKIILKKSIN